MKKITAEEILKNCERYVLEVSYRTCESVILLDDAIEAIRNFLNEHNKIDSKEFVETKLIELYKQYPALKIRYEYRSDCHLIEINYDSEFLSYEEYINFINIENEYLESIFERTFSDENILFITENSLCEIKNPILILGYK